MSKVKWQRSLKSMSMARGKRASRSQACLKGSDGCLPRHMEISQERAGEAQGSGGLEVGKGPIIKSLWSKKRGV